MASCDSVGARHIFPAAHSGIDFDKSLPTAEENDLLKEALELLLLEDELLEDDLEVCTLEVDLESELESSLFDF